MTLKNYNSMPKTRFLLGNTTKLNKHPEPARPFKMHNLKTGPPINSIPPQQAAKANPFSFYHTKLILDFWTVSRTILKGLFIPNMKNV